MDSGTSLVLSELNDYEIRIVWEKYGEKRNEVKS